MKPLLQLLACVPLLTACAACVRLDASPGDTGGRDVVYGLGHARDDADAEMRKPLLMDWMAPDTPDKTPHPAVILVHGGGFERGSKEDARIRALAETLVEHGYACFVINYRLVRDNPPAPPPHLDPMSKAVHAAIVDVKTALRHVTAQAATYGIDPTRIALLGSSAGAIAALGAGLSGNDRFADDGETFPAPPENNPDVSARVAAIVNLWGSADFFLELFTPRAPPIMTVHGDRDFRVGLSLLPAMNIDSHCQENGIPHHYYPIPDAGHGAWDAVVDGKTLDTLVLEFLDRYLR